MLWPRNPRHHPPIDPCLFERFTLNFPNRDDDALGMARCGGVAPTAKRRRSSAPVALRSSSTDRRRSGASLLGSSDDDDDDMITNDDVSMDGIDNTTGAPTTAPSSPHSLVETGDIRLRRRAAALVDKPLIWAQCDACGKWRSLPLCRSETELPKAW